MAQIWRTCLLAMATSTLPKSIRCARPRIQICSALAFSNIVLKKQDKAGLIVFSKTVSTVLKADRGPRHLKKLLYALYRESYDYSEAGYEGLYTTIKRVIPSRSLIFLYTNFDSIHAMERNLPRKVNVVPLNLPAGGGLTVRFELPEA